MEVVHQSRGVCVCSRREGMSLCQARLEAICVDGFIAAGNSFNDVTLSRVYNIQVVTTMTTMSTMALLSVSFQSLISPFIEYRRNRMRCIPMLYPQWSNRAACLTHFRWFFSFILSILFRFFVGSAIRHCRRLYYAMGCRCVSGVRIFQWAKIIHHNENITKHHCDRSRVATVGAFRHSPSSVHSQRVFLHFRESMCAS